MQPALQGFKKRTHPTHLISKPQAGRTQQMVETLLKMIQGMLPLTYRCWMDILVIIQPCAWSDSASFRIGDKSTEIIEKKSPQSIT